MMIQPVVKPRRQFNDKLKRELPLHFMMIPAIILLIVFSYGPMAGLIIAFQKFIPARGLFGNQKWVGLGNFQFLFSMPNALSVIRNTFFIAVSKIIGNMLVPIVYALLLNELWHNKLKRVIQTVIYFPNFISWVVFSGILMDILSPSSGIVNLAIKALGGQSIYFLGTTKWYPVTMIITDVWKNYGFGTVIYLASITTIDPTLYEAANIDGANRWQQIWNVTLPGMSMIIILLMVLNLGNVLNAGFDQIYNTYSVSIYETGDIIDTFVYRLGLLDAQFGPATAMGMFKSVISFILISSAYLFAYKVYDYRVF